MKQFKEENYKAVKTPYIHKFPKTPLPEQVVSKSQGHDWRNFLIVTKIVNKS